MPEFLDLHSKTTKQLRIAADLAVRRHGLRLGQDHLLAALWERDGRAPGEIAAAISVTTPAVTKAAARMVEAGLIVQRSDDRDRRLVRFWLTDAGRALQAPIEAERAQLEASVTAALTDVERRHLLAALAKVHRAAGELVAEPHEDRPMPG